MNFKVIWKIGSKVEAKTTMTISKIPVNVEVKIPKLQSLMPAILREYICVFPAGRCTKLSNFNISSLYHTPLLGFGAIMRKTV